MIIYDMEHPLLLSTYVPDTQPIPDISEKTFKHFSSKIDTTKDGCWEWLGSKDEYGYGLFMLPSQDAEGNYKQLERRAHRIAYTIARGDIPAGLTLDHLCKNKSCVNPAHLEAVTDEENNIRGGADGFGNGHRDWTTQCHEGHVFAQTGVSVVQVKTKHGVAGGKTKRRCAQCQRDKQSAIRARKKLSKQITPQ